MANLNKKDSLDFSSAGYLPLFAFAAELLFQIAVVLMGFSTGVETWVCVVGNQVMFFTVTAVLFKRRGVSFAAATGIKRPFDPLTGVLLVPVALLCIAAFAPLAGAFSLLLKCFGYTFVPDYQISLDSLWLTLLSAFVLGVLPILGEEMLFRGGVLGGLKHKGYVFSILCSAMFFALVHGNMNQLVHQFLLGVVLGYVMAITGSVWAPAIIHFCNNFFAVIIEYVYANGKLSAGVYGYCCGASWRGGAKNVLITLAVCIAAWGALAALLVFAGVRCKKRNTVYNKNRNNTQGASDARTESAVQPCGGAGEKALSAVCGAPAPVTPLSKADYWGGAVSLAVFAVMILVNFVSEV